MEKKTIPTIAAAALSAVAPMIAKEEEVHPHEENHAADAAVVNATFARVSTGFQVGQYVMRRSLTPQQEAEKKMMPAIFAERVGKYPWDRLQVVFLPSERSNLYTCRDDHGKVFKLNEIQIRHVDPSEKHGWRGE